MWKGGWEMGTWRKDWRRRKTEVYVLNHNVSSKAVCVVVPHHLLEGEGSEHYCHLAPWSPELSVQAKAAPLGLWLVRLSVCPSAEPWLL